MCKIPVLQNSGGLISFSKVRADFQCPNFLRAKFLCANFLRAKFHMGKIPAGKYSTLKIPTGRNSNGKILIILDIGHNFKS